MEIAFPVSPLCAGVNFSNSTEVAPHPFLQTMLAFTNLMETGLHGGLLISTHSLLASSFLLHAAQVTDQRLAVWNVFQTQGRIIAHRMQLLLCISFTCHILIPSRVP